MDFKCIVATKVYPSPPDCSFMELIYVSAEGELFLQVTWYMFLYVTGTDTKDLIWVSPLCSGVECVQCNVYTFSKQCRVS